jgi:hypothetical protein
VKTNFLFKIFFLFLITAVAYGQFSSNDQFDKNPIIINPKGTFSQGQFEGTAQDWWATDFIPNEATQSTHKLRSKEINNNPSQINWSLLPGVETANSSQMQRQGIQIRASAEEEVQVYWQSVPLGAGLSLPNDLSFITSAASNQVRLYQGVAPMHLGLPSAAGVLELNLRPGIAMTPRKQSQIHGQVDQWGDWHTNIGHNSGQNNLAVRASIAQGKGERAFLSDAGTPLVNSDDRQEIYQHNAHKNLLLAAVAKPLAKKDLQVSFLNIAREKQVPNITNSASAQAERTSNLKVAALDSQHTIAGNQKFTAHIDGAQTRELFNDPQGEWGQAGIWSTQINQIGASGTWQIPIDRWLIHSSVHWRQSELKRQETLPAAVSETKTWRRTMPGAHLQVKYFIANFVLETNQRVVMVNDRAFQGATTSLDHSGSEHNLGVRWNLSQSQALLASWQKTIHVPALEDYFGNPGLLRPNPELVAEGFQTLELGYEINFNQWQMHTSIFQRRIDDPIALRSDAFGQRQRINWNRAKIDGLEWRLSSPKGKYIVLTTAHTFQQPEGREKIEDRYQELPGKYRWLSALQCQFNLQQWSFGPEMVLKRDGVQDRDGLLLRDNFTDVSLFIQWFPLTSWSGHLGMRAQNLLDKRSAASVDLASEGRRLILDALMSF